MRIYKDSEPYKICFHISGTINPKDLDLIKVILLDNSREYQPDANFLENTIEIGPRNSFKTSWNSNVLQIFRRCGINSIESIEYSTFYPKDNQPEFDNMLYINYNNFEEITKEFIKTIYIPSIERFIS